MDPVIDSKDQENVSGLETLIKARDHSLQSKSLLNSLTDSFRSVF